MIDTALAVIASSASAFLQTRTGWNVSSPMVVVGPPVTDAIGTQSVSETVTLSLVNIEEDRVNMAQGAMARTQTPDGEAAQRAHIRLSLLVLFAAQFSNYSESLRRISYVTECFQAKPVLTPQDTPGMDPSLERLILDLWPTTTYDSSHIWSMFGGSYLPSVIYRVRLVTIDASRPVQPKIPVTQQRRDVNTRA